MKPVSAFGFRVSGFVACNQLSLSVSGFGFRVSSLATNFHWFQIFAGRRYTSLSVSGFGFRRSNFTSAVGFAFRVSGFRRLTPPFDAFFGFPFSDFVDRNYLSLSVSDLRTRVSYLDTTFRSSLPVPGLGFR